MANNTSPGCRIEKENLLRKKCRGETLLFIFYEGNPSNRHYLFVRVVLGPTYTIKIHKKRT